MNILIVDDDRFTLDILEHTLDILGHTVSRAHTGGQALEKLRREDIRMVITDWDMPEMDGLEFCRAVRGDELHGYVYLIMLTGRDDAKSRREGLNAGADDFLFKPLNPDDLMVCFKTAERVLSLETRDVALFAMAKLAESRDPDTGAHVERVQHYSRSLAQNLTDAVKARHGINADFVRLIYQTSALHDLGKVAIQDSILLKPGKLTPGEFEVMKTHATLGAQTLDAALQRFPNASFLRMARDIAASHHERFDGSGYPGGLRAEQIPICARIVAVADVYDALTSRRVYKNAMSHEQARQFIISAKGRSFDPDIVDAFVLAENEFLAIRAKLSEEQRPASGRLLNDFQLARPDDSSGIMIVEDSPIELSHLRDLLSKSAQKVLTAKNVQEGINMFLQHRPDVVVCDWEMPGGTGLELCRMMRTHAVEHPLYFIMLTSHSDKQLLLDAYEAGVNDFVAKPFNEAELLARVKAGMRVSELHKELARKTDRLADFNSELKAANMRLDRLSITDELTGLFNRRHAMMRLEEHCYAAERSGRKLAIAAIDIDHFKSINDTYGHEAGDIVLRKVAAILSESTRGSDLACRIGGEEFLVIFPSQGIDNAMSCAERLRAAVERNSFRVSDTELKLTISIGVACRDDRVARSCDLLRSADTALYQAKDAGRNRVQRFQSVSTHVETTKSAIELPDLPDPSAGARKLIDLDLIASRCGGDHAFAAAVLERFRAQAPLEMKKLADALAAQDRESLRRDAHSVKSMAAYVTADVAAELCKQLERSASTDRLSELESVLSALHREIEQVTAWIGEHGKAQTAVAA